MTTLGSVQQKISCVFETEVLEEPSSKRSYQQYKVVAVNSLRSTALQDDINSAVSTEKLDGTCVYINEFQGKPWLWARLDRKPNKVADRKFKKYQSQLKQQSKQDQPPPFEWNVATDFKDVPDNWIPASQVPTVGGQPQPDSNGHIPGWVPVDIKSRQHCWHLTAVDLHQGLSLVLCENEDANDELMMRITPLSDLVGCTAELIGTHVNANPYGIGDKQYPVHMLVVHGSIKVKIPPELQLDSIQQWFSTTGDVEGVVWHCPSGTLYKLHRHHLGLPWPVKKPSLSVRKIQIHVDMTQYGGGEDRKSSLWTVSRLSGQTIKSLLTLHDALIEQDQMNHT